MGVATYFVVSGIEMISESDIPTVIWLMRNTVFFIKQNKTKQKKKSPKKMWRQKIKQRGVNK